MLLSMITASIAVFSIAIFEIRISKSKLPGNIYKKSKDFKTGSHSILNNDRIRRIKWIFFLSLHWNGSRNWMNWGTFIFVVCVHIKELQITCDEKLPFSLFNSDIFNRQNDKNRKTRTRISHGHVKNLYFDIEL